MIVHVALHSSILLSAVGSLANGYLIDHDIRLVHICVLFRDVDSKEVAKLSSVYALASQDTTCQVQSAVAMAQSATDGPVAGYIGIVPQQGLDRVIVFDNHVWRELTIDFLCVGCLLHKRCPFFHMLHQVVETHLPNLIPWGRKYLLGNLNLVYLAKNCLVSIKSALADRFLCG
jgi:hypothetical protein